MRALVLAVTLVAFANQVVALDISTCGVNVPRGEVGNLTGSLACAGNTGHCADDPGIDCTSDDQCGRGTCVTYAVRLESRATLDMNGYDITGGSSGHQETGVLCRGRDCTIAGGGGSISQLESYGIWHFGRGTLTVSDLTVHHTNRTAIVQASKGKRLVATNVTVHDAPGITGGRDIVATNLDLVGGGVCGVGTVSLVGRRIRGSGITANYVDAERGLDVTGLTVAANCGWGAVVRRGTMRLVDSSVTGAQEFDLVSRKLPELVNTVCGTSRKLESTGLPGPDSWGVCAND